MYNTEIVSITKKIELESIYHFKCIMKEHNAIFAGGAAYAMFHGKRILDHLDEHNTADLDLYFKSESDYSQAVDHMIMTSKESRYDITVEKSMTGLCHDVFFEDRKIQLVGCIFGEPEDIIRSFDFKNLEVCYYWDSKSSKYKCTSSKNASNTNLLDIRHTRSPFLMHRVYKYLTYRGFDSITEYSKQHVTDWIIKTASGYYEENKDGCLNIYVDLLNNYGFIRLLQKTDVISDEDLVYMIGKIKKHQCEDDLNSFLHIGYVKTARDCLTSRNIDDNTIDIVIQEMKTRDVKNGSK